MKGKRFAKEWMGKVVEVSHTFSHFDDHGKAIAFERREPLIGWVVGYTYRRRGKMQWEGEEYGYVFITDGPSELVFLIRPWPHEKTVDALPEHVSLTDKEPKPAVMYYWDERCERIAREFAAEQPRDERGRWVKSKSYKEMCYI